MSRVLRSNLKSILLDSVSLAFIASVVLVKVKQPSEEVLLNLKQNTMVAIGLLVLGVVCTYLINTLRGRTLGLLVFEENPPAGPVIPWYKTVWGWQLLVAFAAAFWTGLSITQFSFYELFSADGVQGARRIFSSLFSPNLEILPQAMLKIVETIFIAFIATILAVPLAFVLSFFAAKNIMAGSTLRMYIYTLLRTLMNVTRSMEPLIWAIVFSVWVGIGPFSGMLALCVHSISSLAKQYSEIIECVSTGPIEGIESTGASKLQTIWFAVVPQVVLPNVSYTIYRWDINVRMATVIGLVGGGGIGTMLIQYQGQSLWNEVGCLVLLIAVVVWAMDTASAYLREALK